MKLLLALALVIVACKKEDLKSEDAKKDPIGQIQNDPATPTPPHGRCTPLGFTTHEPIAVWKMKNGEEMVICNLDETSKTSETEFVGWLNIYPGTAVASERGYIDEVSNDMPIYVFSFGVKKLNDSQVEISKYAENIKLTSAILNCSKIPCTLQKEKCEGKAKLKVDEYSIPYIRDVISGKSKEGPNDVVIANVFNAAVNGDKEALKLVLDYDKQKLRLDGAAAAGFDETKEIIENLVKLGCLKR